MKTRITLLTLLTVGCPSLTLASDIAREVRSGASGNFLEAIGGGGCGQSARIGKTENAESEGCGYGLGLGWEFHWKGFFTEAIQNSYSGLNLGYNLYQNAQWTVDFIALNLSGTTSSKDGLEPNMTEAQRNYHLRNRDTLTLDGGLRASHYWDNNILQVRLEADYSQKHAGAQASVLYGKAWQVKNWNFHALGGAYWQSRTRNEYYWGVSAEESTSQFSAYNAKSTLDFSLEFGATYPLSEHWISRTQITVFRNDDAIADSPLSANQVYGGVGSSLSYVF
ncbi:MAG TPA: MipA/OmpV family protein [Marinagarivorans sp.]